MKLPKRKKSGGSREVRFTLSDSEAVAAQVLCEKAQEIDGKRVSVSELCRALVVAALPMTLDQMRKEEGEEDAETEFGGYVASASSRPGAGVPTVGHHPSGFDDLEPNVLEPYDPRNGD